MCPALLPACCSPCCTAGCAAPLPRAAVCWQSWYPASCLFSHPVLPPSTSLLPSGCGCTLLSQLSPPHRAPRHLKCHLLPPAVYSILCCSATGTYTAPLPHLFTRLMRLRARSCPIIQRFLPVLCHPSFTSVLPLKCQCRLEFLGLGVFYHFRGLCRRWMPQERRVTAALPEVLAGLRQSLQATLLILT